MGKSRIPYLTDTWSPITGCTPVGEGCRNCWAQEVLTRFSNVHGNPWALPPPWFSHPLHVNLNLVGIRDNRNPFRPSAACSISRPTKAGT